MALRERDVGPAALGIIDRQRLLRSST